MGEGPSYAQVFLAFARNSLIRYFWFYITNFARYPMEIVWARVAVGLQAGVAQLSQRQQLRDGRERRPAPPM